MDLNAMQCNAARIHSVPYRMVQRCEMVAREATQREKKNFARKKAASTLKTVFMFVPSTVDGKTAAAAIFM